MEGSFLTSHSHQADTRMGY